jgi:tRNA threonylcarbamoyl adenosine modification protein YeaZ
MPDRLTGATLVIATGHDLSLALLAGGNVLAERTDPMARGHAEALVPAIAELMAPFGGAAASCDRVIVETGPGSFTGLRVGLAAGRALALAWGAELKGVRSTLLAAAEARRQGMEGSLLVALRAPRGQIWVEGFAPGGLESCLAPAALSAAAADRLSAQYDRLADAPPRAAAVEALASNRLGGAELLYVRADDQQG